MSLILLEQGSVLFREGTFFIREREGVGGWGLGPGFREEGH